MPEDEQESQPMGPSLQSIHVDFGTVVDVTVGEVRQIIAFINQVCRRSGMDRTTASVNGAELRFDCQYEPPDPIN
jgi:hypothetical protein